VNKSQKADSQMIAGIGLPVDRSKLLLWFRLGTLAYFIYFYFTVKAQTFEVFLSLGLLAFLSLLPAYLWCAGKAHGLPIVPVFTLGFFPSYILPIQTDSRVLAGYEPGLQCNALLLASALTAIVTLIWQQLCNDPKSRAPQLRLLDLERSTWLLVTFMVLGLLFQIAGEFFWRYGGGAFSMIRGYAGNGATLALFVFSFQLGRGNLGRTLQWLLFGVVSMQVVVDAASFILAGTLVKLGVIGAGYTLGSQKIPWKSGIAAVLMLTVLHAGKADMRQKYWVEGVQGVSQFGIIDYPRIFFEWVSGGWKAVKTGFSSETQEEIASAGDRTAMVAVFLRVLDKTPVVKPFLNGETYQSIPSLLIPRVLNKEKGIAHIGNWILGYYYEFLTLDMLGKTSIGFDLMIEAFANYGTFGVLGLAVVLGLLYGWIGRISIGVPLLSFRFLLAVVVLSGTLSSNNTAGVFVTTLWQSFLALMTLNLFLMKTLPNPLYLRSNASRTMTGGGYQDMGKDSGGTGQKPVISGPPSSVSDLSSKNETTPIRHERPMRFVYGQKRIKK